MSDQKYPGFEERLERALKQGGLKTGHLDRLIGWAPGWTKKLQAGKVPLPHEWESLREISDALGVSYQWLFFGIPEKGAKRAIDEFRRVAADKLSEEDRRRLESIIETL